MSDLDDVVFTPEIEMWQGEKKWPQRVYKNHKRTRNDIMEEIYQQQKTVNTEQIKLADLWKEYRGMD